MEKDWKIFGHQAIKNILNKQLSAGVFPHAYLFIGPQEVGKRTLALEFAQKILGTHNLANHPDFLELNQETEITMEPALAFIGRLSLKPFVGKYKVAIINNAENLNQQSGNALLKTLEEPSDSTIIILVAGFGKILPTIYSRCQIFNFNSFISEQLTDFAGREGLKINQEILDLSFGSFGRLKRLVQDKEFFTAQKDAVTQFDKMSQAGKGQKLAMISDFADMEETDLESLLNCWMFWQFGKLRVQPRDFGKVSAIVEALQGLKRNFNKKLVLQSLFLKI